MSNELSGQAAKDLINKLKIKVPYTGTDHGAKSWEGYCQDGRLLNPEGLLEEGKEYEGLLIVSNWHSEFYIPNIGFFNSILFDIPRETYTRLYIHIPPRNIFVDLCKTKKRKYEHEISFLL